MRNAAFGISFLVVFGLAGTCLAQPVVPGGGGAGQPAVSPYINLLRGNNNINPTLLGLYGEVRPQQQLRQQQGALQQQLSQTNQSVNTLENGDALLVTGKGASFQNYSHYFNNFGTAGAGGGSVFGGNRTSSGTGTAAGGTAGRGMGMSGTTIGQAPSSGNTQRR